MCTEDQRVELAPRDVLIYNYEDRRLSDVFPPDFLINKTRWFGPGGRSLYTLILRDPFNSFASKYRWAVNGTKWTPQMEWVINELPGLWKSYAREFLGLTNLMPKPKVFINYNRWFTEEKYRDEIAGLLNLGSADRGLSEVAKWGPNTWGDSFDNLNFDGRANEMKVLERWRYFVADPAFRELFRDGELISLSEQIFGVIPGTSILTMNTTAEQTQYQEEPQGVISVQLYEPAECRQIVAELKALDGWTAAQVRHAKNADDYEILTRPDVRSSSTLVTAAAEKFYLQFDERMDATLKPLIKQHWQIDLASHSGTHLLRYGPADHYVPHQDTGPGLEDRYFSVVCYLNDDFGGGRTSFPGLNYTATPQTGKAIVFPSNYLHCSEPVTGGEKFVLVSWVNGPSPVQWI